MPLSTSSLLLMPVWARAYMATTQGTSYQDATGMLLDGTTEKLAIKYWPSTTSAITDVDVLLNATGSPGNFKIGVFSNASDAPDAQLGAYTSSWTPSGDGWTGLKTLGTNTGALTLNTPVWIVIEYVDGTLDGSNCIQLQRTFSHNTSNRAKSRHHNGTDWTTTTAYTNEVGVVLKHADATYSGAPIKLEARSAGANIYVDSGTTKTQGVRWKFGSKVKIHGVCYRVYKTGSPGDLVVTVYEGDTSKYSATETAANVVNADTHITYFASPVLLAADTNIHVLFTQAGTSSSDAYELYVFGVDSAYRAALAPADVRHIYGDGTTPSSLTVSDTEYPLVFPILSDPAADLDMDASSGAGAWRTHSFGVGV